MPSTSSTSDTFVETFPSHKQRVYQYAPTKFRIRLLRGKLAHTRTNASKVLVLVSCANAYVFKRTRTHGPSFSIHLDFG